MEYMEHSPPRAAELIYLVPNRKIIKEEFTLYSIQEYR